MSTATPFESARSHDPGTGQGGPTLRRRTALSNGAAQPQGVDVFEVQRQKLQEIEAEVIGVLNKHALEGHERTIALALFAWNEAQRIGMSGWDFTTQIVQRAMSAKPSSPGSAAADMFSAMGARGGEKR